MPDSIVKLIDHAVLQPTQTDADVRAACEFCAELGVASVFVKPSHLSLAVDCLNRSGVGAGSVVGFPHGGSATEIKIAETKFAGDGGARDIDMVVNVGKVLSGDWSYVEADILAFVEAAKPYGAVTKVIFETGLLPTDEMKIRMCQICEAAGVAFVKTSTGFGYVATPTGGMVATGATEHDIRLMRATCGPSVQVKASGGIRSYADATRFVELGATRLGTSATQAIAAGERGASTISTASY